MWVLKTNVLVFNNVTFSEKSSKPLYNYQKRSIFSFYWNYLFPGGQLHLSSVLLEYVQNLIDEVYQINYIKNVPAVNMAPTQYHLWEKLIPKCRQFTITPIEWL